MDYISIDDAVTFVTIIVECDEITGDTIVLGSFKELDEYSKTHKIVYVSISLELFDEDAKLYLPQLPDSVEHLSCNFCGNIYSLVPDDSISLPSSLKRLYCSNNNLYKLPPLPYGLEFIDCTGNYLTSIPDLPYSMRELYCGTNNILSLPKLSTKSLEVLYCHNNKITVLPDSLIECEKLKEIDFSDNPDIKPTNTQLAFLKTIKHSYWNEY